MLYQNNDIWFHICNAGVVLSLLKLHTENSLVQICDKTAITAQINDERSLNRGSYSLLKYSNNRDAVSLKYCSNDGSLMLLFNNDK